MSKFKPSKLIIPYLNYCYSYVEYFVNSQENIFAGAVRSRSGDSKYRHFLNIKLRHGYFPENFTDFSEHSCLLNHLQEHILPMTNSERMLS